MNKYPVSPDDCQILQAVHNASSIREAARLLSCDPSGLTRKVHRISQEYDLLRKVNNKWKLTDTGIQLLSWMESSINAQKTILAKDKTLKIATFGWLLEQALIPKISELRKELRNTSQITFIDSSNLEESLKSSQVDFVISCHAPEDPDITHKRVIKENWTIIAPKKWEKDFQGKSKAQINQLLSEKSYIKHINLNQGEILKNISFDQNIELVLGQINYIVTAVTSNLGWAFVPRLAAIKSIKKNEIFEIPVNTTLDNNFCVWHLRSRKDLQKIQKILVNWMQS